MGDTHDYVDTTSAAPRRGNLRRAPVTPTKSLRLLTASARAYALGVNVREPAVAGRFYPGDPRVLRRDVDSLLASVDLGGAPREVLGLMAPHAGYIYSGATAAEAFARVRVPERVVIMCPNHTGRGARISVYAKGVFRIPGAEIPIDDELADRIMVEAVGAKHDHKAHLSEHAIEVELPFLLACQPRLRIVPIVLGGLSEHEAIELGLALHRAIGDDDVLVVASSDMSHFLPDGETRKVDRVALAPLLDFDPAGLYQTVTQNRISMCGYIPATAMLAYARARGGADRPELVAYATSGDAFGDRSRVVGYASVLV